jgi:hypothetical protein
MGLISAPSVTGLGAAGHEIETDKPTRIVRNAQEYSTPYECPFPLYLICCSGRATWQSINYEPGRILVCTTGYGTAPNGVETDWLFRSDLHKVACTQDVLYAPMYEGTQFNDGPFPPAPTIAYDHNLEVLRDVAPQVRAILVGNRYAETGYCQTISQNDDAMRAESSHRICTFVDEAAAMVRSVGGRLALMLIDYQIILDCYWASGQPLRAKLIEHNVLTGALLGFKFWPKMKPLYDHDREERILPKKLLDQPPYPMLTEWLSGLEAWSGVDYVDGLMKQHPSRLFKGGFDAGIIGQLPNGTI